MKYSDEDITKYVKESVSVTEVMRKLGIKYISGGMHYHIKNRIVKIELDTSHFLGQAHAKGTKSNNRLSPDEIFVYNRLNGRKDSTERLVRALLESDIKYECVECGLDNRWNDKKLVLHVDHINGDPLDNDKSNLRFLCPNCHSQTDTYGAKNIKN